MKTHEMTKKTKKRTKNPLVDKTVGQNLKALREAQGISQERLGAGLDLTFQQIQKYEKGENRVSASTLYEFAHFFEVGILSFFAGLPDIDAKPFSYDAQTMKLIRTFENIKDDKTRKKIIELTKTILK